MRACRRQGMDNDRALLFGAIALNAGLLDAQQLAAIWSHVDTRAAGSIGDALVERGGLTAAERAYVAQLVECNLRRHAVDTRASLARGATEAFRRGLPDIALP